MIRALTLAVILYGVWLSLSGHYTPFLLTVGAVSSVVIVLLAIRMKIFDEEGFPVGMAPRFVAYLPWLTLEMIKSALAVVKIILDPALPISPAMRRFESTTETDLGHFLFANSITFTPGTTTVGLEGKEFLVYAITREGVEGLEESEMAKRCRWVEGSV